METYEGIPLPVNLNLWMSGFTQKCVRLWKWMQFHADFKTEVESAAHLKILHVIKKKRSWEAEMLIQS